MCRSADSQAAQERKTAHASECTCARRSHRAQRAAFLANQGTVESAKCRMRKMIDGEVLKASKLAAAQQLQEKREKLKADRQQRKYLEQVRKESCL